MMKNKELRERDQSILRGYQMICSCRNQKIWNHHASLADIKCSKCLGTLRVVLPPSELSDYTEYDSDDWSNVPALLHPADVPLSERATIITKFAQEIIEDTGYTDLNAETPDT